MHSEQVVPGLPAVSMSTSSKRTIYALLTGIVLVMIGTSALLWVDNRRIQRHTDELNDLRLSLTGREQDVTVLRKQLSACCPDTARTAPPVWAPTQRVTDTDGWNQ